MENKKVQGVGGWLLLYVIILGFGLVSFPLLFIYGSQLGIVLSFALILWLINLSEFILIFTKKKWVPTYLIAAIWMIFIINLGNLLNVGGGFISLVPGIAVNIAWTLYFIKSKRIKNTFIK